MGLCGLFCCVAYIGINRLCTGRLAIISGEVKRSIVGGIRAVSLGHLHAESIIEPNLLGRDIV